MKKLYLIALSVVFLSACEKDIDDKIVGTWRITDVDRVGGGHVPASLPFKAGTFTFYLDETVSYTNEFGVVFQGKYSLERDRENDNGDYSLLISVVHYPTQQLLMDSFKDVHFHRSDRFNGKAVYGSRSYNTEFEK